MEVTGIISFAILLLVAGVDCGLIYHQQHWPLYHQVYTVPQQVPSISPALYHINYPLTSTRSREIFHPQQRHDTNIPILYFLPQLFSTPHTTGSQGGERENHPGEQSLTISHNQEFDNSVFESTKIDKAREDPVVSDDKLDEVTHDKAQLEYQIDENFKTDSGLGSVSIETINDKFNAPNEVKIEESQPNVNFKAAGFISPSAVSQFRGTDEDGSYHFSYFGDVSSRSETRYKDGKVRGQYKYVDPTGSERNYHYVADDQGFRVKESVFPAEFRDSRTYEISNDISSQYHTRDNFPAVKPHHTYQVIYGGTESNDVHALEEPSTTENYGSTETTTFDSFEEDVETTTSIEESASTSTELPLSKNQTKELTP